MRGKWLGLAVGLVGGVCAAWAEVPLRDDAQGTLFGTDRFAVRIDARNGWIAEVLCDGQPVVTAPATAQAYDIRQDGVWVTGSGQAIERLGVERVSSDTIRCRTRAGMWTVDALLQLDPERRSVRRWFDVTWHGASTTKIKSFWIRGGVLPLAEGGRYLLPAQYPPRSVAAAELTADRRTGSWRSPYVVIGENGCGWSVMWALDELQPYADRGSTGVEEGRGEIRITQSFNMQGHVRNGVTQRVGDSWLWVQPNDAETVLRRLPEWFAAVGQMPPEGRPEWLKRVILYSFHPGGTIGSNCRDLGGFPAATALLPHIDGLGCNAIWLMPLEDKSIYWPRDYYKLQEGIGTPDDFKAFTARARSLGMRVWQDCVPHGGCNEYPRAKEHPEWLAQNEDGSTLHYWCFDFNWPTWIDYMRGVVSFYMREYGLDGFRIDACGGSKIPNWNPDIPYARASHAQAQGGFAMQRALREEVRKVKPDGANLAEVGASVHGAVSDSTYDFELCYHVLHDFRRSPADVFVPRLRRWLHEQQYAEVPDLVRMRHVESHDSLRSGLWYGADAQRALVALISWIHGIPMVYHEMEDGHYEAYRRIFHVRRHVPELNTGTADYLSVTAPDGVFACLRSGERPARADAAWHEEYAWDTRPNAAARASVVLMNLNGTAVTGRVSVPKASLPAALQGAAWARDLMSGERVALHEGVCEVSLPAFGYTVLRLESATLPSCTSVPEEAVSKPAVAARADGATLRVGPLVADAKTGWARAWRTGWRRETPLSVDVALPAGWGAKAVAPARLNAVTGGVDAEYVWQGNTLTVQQREADDGVEIKAAWPDGAPVDAALVITLDEARAWYADTAEGRFESPFRVRHPDMTMLGTVGSIYRLPQGGAVLWDSRRHPFGLDGVHARVGVRLPDGCDLALTFDPARLPASVRLLDRVGERHGLNVAVVWRGDEHGVTSGVDEVRFHIRSAREREAASPGSGDPRLIAVGGGWQFENAHYRARLSRAGTLVGLWRRNGDAWQTIVQKDGLYTDKGFAEDRKYIAQENDVEASARIEPAGADGIRLRVTGEMRGFGRFEKLGHPVRFNSVFTLGEGPAFRRFTAFQSTAATGRAFLSQRTAFDGAARAAFSDAAGVILSRDAYTIQGRTCETAKAKDPSRLPTDIRIACADGVTVRLADLRWTGVRPGNVFLHGLDLHLAWLDGDTGTAGPDTWHGVSMSVSCEEDAVATPDDAAQSIAAVAAPVGLVRDGSFDGYGAIGGALRLVRSGLDWPSERAAAQVSWRLPEGAEIVREGGNPCARVDGDGASYRLIHQTLAARALTPGTTLRLTARMRGEGVQKGDIEWKTACLRWCVLAEGRTSYQTVSLPVGDSAWREYSVTVTLPQQFSNVAMEAGLNGNCGRVWIDDVQVTEQK